MTEIIRIDNVKFKNILDIKNILIDEGEVVAVVGRSGSGKTTTLLLLNKMISPDEGDVYYYKKNIKDINAIELRREVVMLGQDPVVFDGNVRDNLNQGRIFSGKKPKNDDELKKVLDYVELDKSLDETPESFSGGEKQRLAIARVILMEPNVYLLDEPSSALDSDLAKSTIKKIVEIARSNKKTIVMITHSDEIAKEFSDRIIKIDDGRVI